MCGIGLILDKNHPHSCGIDLKMALKRRGPDFQGEVSVGESTFAASVLHIQGKEMCQQPYVSDSKDILLWNGEVFGGVQLDPEQSDTDAVAHLLGEAMDEATALAEDDSNFMKVTIALSAIEGPYAFIYYHARSGRLVYGRDPFGRRSLIAARPAVLTCSADLEAGDDSKKEDVFYENMLIISSICPGQGFVCYEVPVGAIFVTELQAGRIPPSEEAIKKCRGP